MRISSTKTPSAIVGLFVIVTSCQSKPNEAVLRIETGRPTSRPGLAIVLLIPKTQFDSPAARPDLRLRFTNNTDCAVTLPVGRIVMEGNLFVRLYRRSGPNPFATPDGPDIRSPGFFTVSNDAVIVPAGGSYDLSLDRWPYLSWVCYLDGPADSDDSGTWLLQAQFDARYGDWSPPASGPPTWQTNCLSSPITVSFGHSTPTRGP